jgi:hypothetical protein
MFVLFVADAVSYDSYELVGPKYELIDHDRILVKRMSLLRKNMYVVYHNPCSTIEVFFDQSNAKGINFFDKPKVEGIHFFDLSRVKSINFFGALCQGAINEIDCIIKNSQTQVDLSQVDLLNLLTWEVNDEDQSMKWISELLYSKKVKCVTDIYYCYSF